MHVEETIDIDNGKKSFSEEKLNEFASKTDGVKVESFIKEGVAYDEIVNHSEECICDLIILYFSEKVSCHINYNAPNVLRITRLSNCPVLVIPASKEKFEIKKILFVADFSFDSDNKENIHEVFFSFLNLTEAFKPEIELLYVNLDKREEKKVKENMQNFISAYPKHKLSTHITRSESVEDGTLEFIKKSNSSIISVAGHGSGDYYTSLRTSISEKILNKSDFPVLFFRIRS